MRPMRAPHQILGNFVSRRLAAPASDDKGPRVDVAKARRFEKDSVEARNRRILDGNGGTDRDAGAMFANGIMTSRRARRQAAFVSDYGTAIQTTSGERGARSEGENQALAD